MLIAREASQNTGVNQSAFGDMFITRKCCKREGAVKVEYQGIMWSTSLN